MGAAQVQARIGKEAKVLRPPGIAPQGRPADVDAIAPRKSIIHDD
jgi:hypothetical protein